jgi:hypothetical protein
LDSSGGVQKMGLDDGALMACGGEHREVKGARAC